MARVLARNIETLVVAERDARPHEHQRRATACEKRKRVRGSLKVVEGPVAEENLGPLAELRGGIIEIEQANRDPRVSPTKQFDILGTAVRREHATTAVQKELVWSPMPAPTSITLRPASRSPSVARCSRRLWWCRT
jgi:hypothetical protein